MSQPLRSLFRWKVDDRPGLGKGQVDLLLREVEDGDDAELGMLMEQAYAGTIDDDLGDNSDGLIEIQEWRREGGVPECSTVAVRDDHCVAACLVTRAPSGNWWIGYVYTDPAVKSRGIATFITARSLDLVRAAGALEVRAGVTDGNEPSERLLRRIGFVRIGPA